MHSHECHLCVSGRIVFRVLILVLMEDALARRAVRCEMCGLFVVLILVLMEDALAHMEVVEQSDGYWVVLILVLMEDALALGLHLCRPSRWSASLNPCSNGRCTRTHHP